MRITGGALSAARAPPKSKQASVHQHHGVGPGTAAGDRPLRSGQNGERQQKKIRIHTAAKRAERRHRLKAGVAFLLVGGGKLTVVRPWQVQPGRSPTGRYVPVRRQIGTNHAAAPRQRLKAHHNKASLTCS